MYNLMLMLYLLSAHSVPNLLSLRQLCFFFCYYIDVFFYYILNIFFTTRNDFLELNKTLFKRVPVEEVQRSWTINELVTRRWVPQGGASLILPFDRGLT